MTGLPEHATAATVALALVLVVGAAAAPRRARDPRSPGGSVRDAHAAAGLDADAVAALEHVARELRSGLSLTAALGTGLTAHPGVLVPVRRSLERGAALDQALGEALGGATRPSTDETLALHALGCGVRNGARAADAIELAVDVARERRAWRLERRSYAAQAQLSALLLTLLPIAFAAWGLATSGRVRDAYAVTPLTSVLTGAGLALNAGGWWWMRRLVRGRSA